MRADGSRRPRADATLQTVACDRARRRHRLTVLIGTGLVAGVALAVLPSAAWARLGAALFGGGAWLARSRLAPALLGALVAALPTANRQAAVEVPATKKT